MSAPRRFHLAGVIGWPVLHSRSPLLHNHWLAQAGLEGRYVPLEIPVSGLAAALLSTQFSELSACFDAMPAA